MKTTKNFALSIIVILSAFTFSCSSPSQQRFENVISEKCVVLDFLEIKDQDSQYIYTKLKLKRISDRVIVMKTIQGELLYDVNDTILVSFDKRFDY